MIKGINESKTLAKHIACVYRCEFEWRICNSGQKKNNDKCQWIKPIRHRACEKYYVWNLRTCACKCDKDSEIGEYLQVCKCMKSFVDNLVVTRDEIEDTQKSVVINHSGVINYWLITFVLLLIAYLQ